MSYHVTIMAVNNYELYQKGNTQIDPLKSDALLKENFIKAIGESKITIYAAMIYTAPRIRFLMRADS
jgi:hypothetical protein